MTDADVPIEIAAETIAEGFGIQPAAVPGLLRDGAITTRLYRGVEEDRGTWLCVLFFGNARLRIVVDAAGRPIRRSLIDFGARPLPASLRGP